MATAISSNPVDQKSLEYWAEVIRSLSEKDFFAGECEPLNHDNSQWRVLPYVEIEGQRFILEIDILLVCETRTETEARGLGDTAWRVTELLNISVQSLRIVELFETTESLIAKWSWVEQLVGNDEHDQISECVLDAISGTDAIKRMIAEYNRSPVR